MRGSPWHRVVETDADLLQLTSLILRRAGREVVTAIDGIEAQTSSCVGNPIWCPSA